MRRSLLQLAAIVATLAPLQPALAQIDPTDRGSADSPDADSKSKSKDEWSNSRAPLPQLRNAGPCPFVKVLYDAGRYVEFKDAREAAASVGYTGEIQGISSGCAYRDDEPIKLRMEMLFELGRGPAAQGDSKTYRYWVAVTQRNQDVLAKQWFDLPARFPSGQDRVYARETIDEIVIPRSRMTLSGANFEVLVGFDVTPEMAAFNRDGKRFRVNAGSTVAAGSAATQP